MTDETNVAEQPETDEIDYKAKYEEAQKNIAGLLSKKDELMAETKAAKEEKRKQENLATQAKQEQLDIAQKNGEFEKLWKQEQQEKEKALQDLQTSRQERRNEKINLSAMKIAVDLAKGDANKAELLSDFLARSIGKVADEFGHIDADILSSVRTQFETDKKYSPLIGGNQSVGSGAPGNTRGAQQDVKTITRSEFDTMPHAARSKFFSNGGKLTD